MSGEAAFSIVGGNVEQLEKVSLEEIGFRERQDLQRWIESYPEIVGPDLLVVTTELDRWQYGVERVRNRLDVLFLDSVGSLVVAELKRGEAPDTVDLQALKYAAYCSQLTVEDVVADHARYHGTDEATARDTVFEHAPSLRLSGMGPVKIRLVAESFKPSVTSTALWLRDYDLDIGCIEITARRLGDGTAVITSRRFLPLPIAEDYLVKRRRREKAEEEREASGRRQNVVTELLAAGAVEPVTELGLKLEAFNQAQREAIERGIADDADVGVAEWTGLSWSKAVRCRKDGETYSSTGLVLRILELHGHSTSR
ncbi:MAG: hypothetical protein M3Q49_08880 [Actinomycetota bacterium]|nr:hypothetical protein [Actinomycetota bacterium]MDP9485881.1 hypothetical protein [Actinomycetota bacterium]